MALADCVCPCAARCCCLPRPARSSLLFQKRKPGGGNQWQARLPDFVTRLENALLNTAASKVRAAHRAGAGAHALRWRCERRHPAARPSCLCSGWACCGGAERVPARAMRSGGWVGWWLGAASTRWACSLALRWADQRRRATLLCARGTGHTSACTRRPRARVPTLCLCLPLPLACSRRRSTAILARLRRGCRRWLVAWCTGPHQHPPPGCLACPGPPATGRLMLQAVSSSWLLLRRRSRSRARQTGPS